MQAQKAAPVTVQQVPHQPDYSEQLSVMVIKKIFFLLVFFPLAPFLSGCMSPPAGLDLSSQRATAHNLYVVEAHPVAGALSINKIHAWEVRIARASGEPVTGARIAVHGGMPQHGHGFPTRRASPANSARAATYSSA
jgi:hypothetical protein